MTPKALLVFGIILHGVDDASPDSEENVQHRNAANENRNHDGGDGGDLGCGVKSRNTKYIANAHAPRVPHEEFGWMPVVEEKADKGACKDEEDQRVEAVSREPCDEGERDGGNGADTAGEAVHAVNHVERIDHGGDPEDGQEGADRGGDVALRMQVDMHAEMPCPCSRDDLEEKLHLGLKAEFVVGNT